MVRRSPICIAHPDMTLTWSKVKVTDLVKFRKFYFSVSFSSTILACSWKLMVDYDSIGPSLQLFGARFLNFSPVGGHMTPKFVKRWHHQNPLGFISAQLAARSLWLWLQVGRNKPCTLAAMTASPLPRILLYFSSQSAEVRKTAQRMSKNTKDHKPVCMRQYCSWQNQDYSWLLWFS